MRDVDSVNLISFRIIGIAIKSPPAKSRRPDEKIIKSPDIKDDNGHSAHYICPARISGEKLGKMNMSMTIRPMMPSGR